MTSARGPAAHRGALRCAAGLVACVVTLAQPSPAQQPSPADSTCEAGRAAVERGWQHWAAGEVDAAQREFRSGVRLCPTARGAYTGLGYVSLRRGLTALAIAQFDSALSRDRADLDAALGLGMAAFRGGEAARARLAFTLADSLAPGDSTAADYLRRLPTLVDSTLLPPKRRPADLQLIARTGRRIFELRDDAGGWRPFWIKAVNLGAALPGRHPAEFPPDDGTYEGWISDLAELGANTVRVYTVHPPHFYRALRDWNLQHPTRPLYLIHGVWTELPPGPKEEHYDDPAWHAAFLDEMRRVVDLLHGRAALPHRAGHASGMYLADVSPWTIGYIIGREWEPFSVQAFVARHPQRTRYDGRFVRVDGGNAVDVWLATVADSMIAYEMREWNAQRPLAYTNWPTLDPLHHPTETSRAEEAAWHRRRRERPPEASREYDNDVIALDATKMHATPEFTAGLFASFHAYPYYPDFMVLDSAYATARSPEGPSHYFGYLRELVEYHGSLPVVISEYGVPSSRGNAHLQPQGWHHGGHDEASQAAINARLTREIAASGAAGVGLFALIDEWFKKNWLVIDFEHPLERNRLWLNVLDAEQNYGVIAMRPGVRDSTIVVDGRRDDWAGRRPYLQRATDAPATSGATRVDALWVDHDEAYVYLRLDVGSVDWSRARYLIGIDTYDAARGDRALPSGAASPVGLEFVLDLAGPDAARLLVDRPYNPYRLVPIRGAQPPAAQSVYNRPFQSRANRDGRYDTLVVTPNRRTLGRDGRVYEAQRYERNLLRHARQHETTLADWYADSSTGTIEIRLAWGLLQVTDPSSRSVLHGMDRGRAPTSRSTDGFRFVVQSLPLSPSESGDLLPRAGTALALPPLWTWPTWEAPRWYAERKPLFAAMQETFARIPDSGPSPPR